MSRLTSHQRKEEDKKIMYLIGGFVLFVIFFMVFGFRLVLNSATFINKGNSSAANEQSNNEGFYGTITMDTVVDATNSATIAVEGTVNNFNTVEFYINGTKVKRTSLGNKTQFTEKITGLKKGENEIHAIASSTEHKQTKESKSHTVFYKDQKLELEITSPADGATVSTEEIIITGKTDKDASVTVNNLPAVIDATGTFQKPIKMKDGENTITVEVVDIAGSTLEKTITITYKKED